MASIQLTRANMQVLDPCGHMHTGEASDAQDALWSPEAHAEAASNMGDALLYLVHLTQFVPLRSLSLYNLTLPPEHIWVLETVLYQVSTSLKELCLDLRTISPTACIQSKNAVAREWVFNSQDKRRIFQVLGCLKRLRKLTLPPWETFVGDDSESVEPLTRLQNLECVYVDSVPKRTEECWIWKFVAL